MFCPVSKLTLSNETHDSSDRSSNTPQLVLFLCLRETIRACLPNA
jgi:hypothetical protein